MPRGADAWPAPAEDVEAVPEAEETPVRLAAVLAVEALRTAEVAD